MQAALDFEIPQVLLQAIVVQSFGTLDHTGPGGEFLADWRLEEIDMEIEPPPFPSSERPETKDRIS